MVSPAYPFEVNISFDISTYQLLKLAWLVTKVTYTDGRRQTIYKLYALSFLLHWDVTAPTTELEVKKELKPVGSQSV